MANPFGTSDMAAGYATSRPPVHLRVIELVSRELGRSTPFRFALDVGCGAGMSTKALDGMATRSVGMDPAEAMLKWATPSGNFVVGAAEALPFGAHTFDLITAAGSLNYADPDLFFPEAARVLAPDGVLAVYDFSPAVDEWWTKFYKRYPPPASEGRELDLEILADVSSGFHMVCQRHFEIAITLTPDFYLDYVMTETNVAAAVRGGVPRSDIRAWCAESLWKDAPREMRFPGYFACLIADA
jgi:SAM-dependent methyltransferase